MRHDQAFFRPLRAGNLGHVTPQVVVAEDDADLRDIVWSLLPAS